jgi:multidrug efflux system membrane fusion protein
MLAAFVASCRYLFMSKNLVSASIIAAALLLWLGSGLFSTDSAQQDHPSLTAQQAGTIEPGDKDLSRVRVEVIRSEARRGFLVLRGRTESKRMVEVKAEIAGKVVRRPVERGARVVKGDLLCEIAVDDRAAAVAEARAALEDAKIEYEGSLKLKEQGLQSETAIARAATRLETARAQLRRQDLNLERTKVVAPFGGVVEELHMNTGDYAVAGAACATLIDLNPMLVRADVTEAEVESLHIGDRVFGRTSVGRDIEGVVTFAGKQSDPVTRTYPVEITVENADYSIRSGLTVSVRIGLEEVQAHQLSPALLTLGDQGGIGIRIVDTSNRVRFYAVSIVEDGPEGVWITGLPETTQLITVGQEFVSNGEMVEPVYTNDSDAEAAQP